MIEVLNDIVKEIYKTLQPFLLNFIILVGLVFAYIATGKIEDYIEELNIKRKKYNKVLTDQDFIENREMKSSEFLRKREMTPVEQEMKERANLVLTKVGHYLTDEQMQELSKMGVRECNDLVYTYTFENINTSYIKFDNLMQNVDIKCKFVDLKMLELIERRMKELGWKDEIT